MKLHAMGIMAWQLVDGEQRLRIRPGIVLATDEDDAIRRSLEAAFVAFPENDGWSGHQAIAVEVPSRIDLESYRLTWQIETL